MSPSSLDLEGKVALVTGANTGLGRVTAMRLAQRGAQIFVACRSEERAQGVLADLRALRMSPSPHFLPLELADLDSVRRCANAFLELGLPLHILVNNAGVAGARGVTRSGFELAFGVNHLGHFLLTRLLEQRLRASAPARIVTVASRAHRRATGIEWDAVRRPTATLTGVREYAVSKLANVLFSAELGQRLRGTGVTTYSLHPGVIDTEIWRQLPAPLRVLNRWRLRPPGEGVETILYCAASPSVADETGWYYADARRVAPSTTALDAALAAELWRRSVEWAG